MRSRWEWPIVIGLLLIAFFFRVWTLNDVPPGLHHDEVIIGQVAQDILGGHLGIYFTAGYGHEPLYHYVVAGMFAAIGANAFVLRLTSAFLAVLGLATTYVFVRRIFSPIVAIGTLAWMSISLWPVFFARVGLRGIILPLLTTLTAYFLWRALFERRTTDDGQRMILPSSFIPARVLACGEAGRLAHPSSFILPGILLGLTLYTYQASRVFPLIFGLFLLFVFVKQWRVTRHTEPSSLIPARVLACGEAGRLAHPSSFIASHALRSMLTFFISALIVTAPLIIYLTFINPSAESRVADLSGPLNQLRAGDPSAVLASALNTLGMFTYRGDAVPIYNVSGRPVFPEIFGAALFVIGLLISLWRWKRPAYLLLLLWFFISLIPAMVTPFSPNFVRTIAAWPVPFVFAGLAMAEILQFARRRSNQRSAISVQRLVTIILVAVLVGNAALTFNDYFVQWPTGDYVRFWQQATWTQAVRALNADPSITPIAASGLSVLDSVPGADFDRQTFDLLGLRPDLKVKWFDCRNAMLYPQEGIATRYLVPAYAPCDADLEARFWTGATLSDQPRWPDTRDPIFTLHSLVGSDALNAAIARSPLRPVWLGGESFSAQNPTSDLKPAPLPFEFTGLDLLSWGIDQDAMKAGEKTDVFTYWQIAQPITPPLKIFVHLTTPDGKIAAQWDGLDVNVGTLEPGDIFVQQHQLDLPADLPPGPYRISLGVYRPDSGARLNAELAGLSIDSIVLGMLTVR